MSEIFHCTAISGVYIIYAYSEDFDKIWWMTGLIEKPNHRNCHTAAVNDVASEILCGVFLYEKHSLSDSNNAN